MLSDLTDWFKAPHAVNAPNGLQVGQTLLIQPTPDAESVRVHRPDGSITTFKTGQDPLVYADTAHPGIYSVDVYKGTTQLQHEAFAVNLFSSLESHIAPAASLPIGTLNVQPAQDKETGQREYWPWIALLGLIILVIEWYLFNRRQQLPTPRRLQTLLSRGVRPRRV